MIHSILHFQDTMNALFTATSIADRGTLYQIKEMFNHRSVKKNVMGNFQHVWDLLKVLPIKLIVLFVMEQQ